MRILITGFDPFGGEAVNPAYEVLKELSKEIAGAEIVTLEVPTVFHKAIQKTTEKMAELMPDVVIAIGQAGGRFGITPERVAINIDDARIPDNEGIQPLNTEIFADGENAYFSTLPVKKITQAIMNAGIPASLSNSAGTFVCNHLMYGILYTIAKQKQFQHIRGGFIHVPFLPEQVVDKPEKPSMNRIDIVKGIEIAIETCIMSKYDQDDIVMGKTE